MLFCRLFVSGLRRERNFILKGFNSYTLLSSSRKQYKINSSLPISIIAQRNMSQVSFAKAKLPMVKLPEVLEKIRPKQSPELDYSTNSNYRNFKVLETYLDFEILFNKKIINGFVEYDLEILNPVHEIVLDVTTVQIQKVLLNECEVSDYKIECENTKNKLGNALIITSGKQLIKSSRLKIFFNTTTESTALQFLNKNQTDGKVADYLFSQSEPIHARSIYPCFDTPSIKSPFKVRVTSPLKTLVSCLTDKERQTKETNDNVYHFIQPVPIPAYLFAIVSGDITSARIGPRSLIYTEPVGIQRCANEFKDNVVEKFLNVLEKLIYNYEWTDYDFVIAPMAFPYGGMENPQLTLGNSTIISGDGENIDVIAHELAHSYSGNLITNASWEHFWLNEGWTVYLERRILAALHGEAYRHFSSIIGWNDLEESISRMDTQYSKLIQNLKDGSDPDDAFSTVPYEKGFNFLFHLETVAGGYEKFDPFIKHYFTTFNKKSLDTYQFIETLFEFYYNFDYEVYTKLLEVDYKTWLLEEGLPPKPDFDTTLVNECLHLSEKWCKVISDEKEGTLTAEKLSTIFDNETDIKHYSSNQLVVFLDHLATLNKDSEYLSSKNGQTALKFMQDNYSRIVKNNNAEVKFRLFKILLLGKKSDVYQSFADWLGTVGRMKFVRPGYLLLNQVDRELAVKTFRKFENSYHPICIVMVKKDINLD